MTNVSQFSVETKVYLNEFLGDIFKNLNVDIKMSSSCGQDEPLTCPKNAFFSSVIGIDFVTYYYCSPCSNIFIFKDERERSNFFLKVFRYWTEMWQKSKLNEYPTKVLLVAFFN